MADGLENRDSLFSIMQEEIGAIFFSYLLPNDIDASISVSHVIAVSTFSIDNCPSDSWYEVCRSVCNDPAQLLYSALIRGAKTSMRHRACPP